jgi:hypothetical protein
MKLEIRSTKSETNSKFKYKKIKHFVTVLNFIF